LAKSGQLWHQRIAMIATAFFIGKGDYTDALNIAQLLRNHPHDLIHKAVGWMLREIGNRDKAAEVRFLNAYYQTMPRTMLRYAIEKFPEHERQAYLNGTI
jgi:3-methyladenine DNA glycosylase AlkD